MTVPSVLSQSEANGPERRLHPQTKRVYQALAALFACILLFWNATDWLAPIRPIAQWERLLVTFSILGLITTTSILFCARFVPIVAPSTAKAEL